MTIGGNPPIGNLGSCAGGSRTLIHVNSQEVMAILQRSNPSGSQSRKTTYLQNPAIAAS